MTNNAIGLVYRAAVGETNIDEALAPCASCGTQRTGNHRRDAIIQGNNTDRALLRAPGSPRVCDACAHAWTTAQYRSRNIVADSNGLRMIQFSELWGVLAHLPDPPFVVCITKSYKKHMLPKAEVTVDAARVWLSGENGAVEIARRLYDEWIATLPAALLHYGKGELETGEYRGKSVTAHGIAAWRALDLQLREWRRHPAFGLVLFAAPTKQRQEASHE